jgi:hypothetical protein
MTARALRLIALLIALALGLTGCISIKTEPVTQRAPGVVTLGGSVCVSDYDSSTYTTCNASNVAEVDRTTCSTICDGDNNTAPERGQLLLGFRVPDGTTAPTSFQSDAQDTTFNASPSYTAALTGRFTPIPGEHWVGYVSGFKTIDPKGQASDRLIAFHAEFALHPQTAPLTTLHWRLVAGFRALDDSTQSGAPIDCNSVNPFTICTDTPVVAAIPGTLTDLTKSVSDIAVLAGTPVAAAQGQTVTLTFPVSDVDGGAKGPQNLALSATTALPGSTPNAGAGIFNLPANTTKNATVTVPIPPGTPLGAYPVTLTATDNSTPAGAPVVRTGTATVTVVDKIAPTVQIGTPGDGAVFTVGQRVAAAYSCTEELNGSDLATCSGPVANGAPIDTSSPGQKTFTVNASDKAGNATSLTRTYTVAALPRRTLNISLPFVYTSSRKSTRFSSLTVKGVPKGSTVTVRCKGHGCPKKLFTKKKVKGSVSLKPYLKKALPTGLKLTITVSKPGFVSMIKTLTIRSKAAPKIVTTCKAPGAKKASRCS